LFFYSKKTGKIGKNWGKIGEKSDKNLGKIGIKWKMIAKKLGKISEN
jgi:hypothetical protein